MIKAYANGTEEIFFEWALPMRTRSLDASALRTHPLGRIVHFQLGQSLLRCVGRRGSFTKQESQILVSFFGVKSTVRMESISAPHFSQRSACVSLISTFGVRAVLEFSGSASLLLFLNSLNTVSAFPIATRSSHGILPLGTASHPLIAFSAAFK